MNSIIRFKDYEFSHNPETLKITTEKSVSEQDVVFGKTAVRDFGNKNRIVIGEGRMFGEDCIYQFVKLFKVKEESGCGILSLPFIKPFYAYFRSLEFLASPAPDIIAYKFVFVEDVSRKDEIYPEKFYTLCEGEDLWDAAYKFKTEVEILLKLNPRIKRPDEVNEGDEVRVC